MAAVLRLAINSLIALVAALSVPAAAHFQAAGTGISTDQAQYRPGDTISICYSVPGPGPITITDFSSDGSSAVLASYDDDGTGGCINAIAQGPASTERLVLTWSDGTNSASAETAYQVVNAGTLHGNVVLTISGGAAPLPGEPPRIFNSPGGAGIPVYAVAAGNGAAAPVATALTDGSGAFALTLPPGLYWVFIPSTAANSIARLSPAVLQRLPDGTVVVAWQAVDLTASSDASVTLRIAIAAP